jgi:acyl-CoA dehydrogenase
MLDDWKINWEWRDPAAGGVDLHQAPQILRHDYSQRELAASASRPYAHSEVVRKLSSRSLTAAVTVMVPNSLGPGELLMRFGTKEQQQQWLPRLADWPRHSLLRADQSGSRLPTPPR